MTDKKNSSFHWDEDRVEYHPQKKQFPAWKINQEIKADYRQKESYTYELYIKPKAQQDIWNHIDYGIEIQKRKNEQGGILLGQVFEDVEEGLIYGLVSHAIPAIDAVGDPVYLEMNHEVWKNLLIQADTVIDKANEDIQIIGWYHTHPNELDVFMSSTDLMTQNKWFRKHWHFAVVINPQRKIWRVFHGAEAEECKGYYLLNDIKEVNERSTFSDSKTDRKNNIPEELYNQPDENMEQLTSQTNSFSIQPFKTVLLRGLVLLLGFIFILLFWSLPFDQKTPIASEELTEILDTTHQETYVSRASSSDVILMLDSINQQASFMVSFDNKGLRISKFSLPFDIDSSTTDISSFDSLKDSIHSEVEKVDSSKILLIDTNSL